MSEQPPSRRERSRATPAPRRPPLPDRAGSDRRGGTGRAGLVGARGVLPLPGERRRPLLPPAGLDDRRRQGVHQPVRLVRAPARWCSSRPTRRCTPRTSPAVSKLGFWSVTDHRLASTLLGTGAVVMIGLVARQIGSNRAGIIAAVDRRGVPEPLDQRRHAPRGADDRVLTCRSCCSRRTRSGASPVMSHAIWLGLAFGLAAPDPRRGDLPRADPDAAAALRHAHAVHQSAGQAARGHGGLHDRRSSARGSATTSPATRSRST